MTGWARIEITQTNQVNILVVLCLFSACSFTADASVSRRCMQMTETLQGNDFRDSGWLQSLQKDDVQLLICPLMLLVSLMKRQCPSLYLAPGRILNFTASRKRKRKKVWVLQLHTDVADLILSKPGRDPACTPRLKQKKKHFFLSARKPLQILTKAASSVPNYLRKTAHCLP